VGTGGTRTTSTTIGSSRPNSTYYRIDVENPNPGVRAGNLHIQDGLNTTYYYDFDTDTFTGAPEKWLRECEQDPKFDTYVSRGKQYLNVK